MSERVEVRGVIASKQGLSCESYFMLSSRTAHLRDRCYISVRDGDNLFLPKDPHEHFPVTEIEKFYLKRLNLGFFESIGAGGAEVVFILEGPAAEEGAEAITAALPDVNAASAQVLFGRWIAALPEKLGYLQVERLTAQGAKPPAYRPERRPERDGPPQPFTPEQADTYDPDRLTRKLGFFEAEKRRALARWGLLADYDRSQRRPKPQPTEPWRESYWT